MKTTGTGVQQAGTHQSVHRKFKRSKGTKVYVRTGQERSFARKSRLFRVVKQERRQRVYIESSILANSGYHYVSRCGLLISANHRGPTFAFLFFFHECGPEISCSETPNQPLGRAK